MTSVKVCDRGEIEVSEVPTTTVVTTTTTTTPHIFRYDIDKY